MILLMIRGKLKRWVCSVWGHRLEDSEWMRDGVYDPGDFCERCGHWI